MAVTIPGVVLSSLIFRLKSSAGDSIGLLLGEMHSHSVADITDTQSAGTREERRICIQSYLMLETRFDFCDARGNMEEDSLEAVIPGRVNEVVGWFRFRRSSSHRPSVIEKNIHRQLSFNLPKGKKDVLFLLFGEHISDNSCIQAMEYSAHQYCKNRLQAVQLKVVNLKATATSRYQNLPVAPVSPFVSSYQELVARQHEHMVEHDTGELKYVVAMEEMYKALLLRLEPLTDALNKSTKEVLALHWEVEQLQKEVSAQSPDDSLSNTLKERLIVSKPSPEQDDEPALIQLEDDVSPCVSRTSPPAANASPSTPDDAFLMEMDDVHGSDAITQSQELF